MCACAIGIFFNHFHVLIFETGSYTELGAKCIVWTGGPSRPSFNPSLTSALQFHGRCCHIPLLQGCWRLNSSPYLCALITLPPDTSPRPNLYYFYLHTLGTFILKCSPRHVYIEMLPTAKFSWAQVLLYSIGHGCLNICPLYHCDPLTFL